MEDDPSVVPKMTLDSVGNIASAAWNEDDDEEALDGDLEEVEKVCLQLNQKTEKSWCRGHVSLHEGEGCQGDGTFEENT